MIYFTEEEKCIVDIYKDKSRLHTVSKMYEALPYIETEDMKVLVKSTLDKLLKIDDRRYRTLLRGHAYLKGLEEMK